MRAEAENVPDQVVKFAGSLPQHSVALIGCRSGDESHECCEYDLAVFSEESSESQVVRLDSHTVELLYFDAPAADKVYDLYGMKIVKDAKFKLASAARDMSEDTFRKALVSSGRKSLVSSLFCLRSMADRPEEPVLAAMWAKIAAYRFMSGSIALSGSRPMPLHEMEQARAMEAPSIATDGIQAAFESIGVERATRPAIARSLEALRELISGDYDRDLVMSKIDSLQSRQMLSDCYYYAGRCAAENLARRNETYHRRYAKLIQLALDLTGDVQLVENLRSRMFTAANAMLKE